MLVPADATLLVGVRAESDHDGPPGDAMAGLDAVAGGPDVRRAGAQVVVDDDAAGLAHADARGPGKVRVGANPEPDHHEVGRDGTRRGLHGGDASVGGGESGDRGAESQVDPRGPHRVRDSAAMSASSTAPMGASSRSTTVTSRPRPSSPSATSSPM